MLINLYLIYLNSLGFTREVSFINIVAVKRKAFLIWWPYSHKILFFSQLHWHLISSLKTFSLLSVTFTFISTLNFLLSSRTSSGRWLPCDRNQWWQKWRKGRGWTPAVSLFSSYLLFLRGVRAHWSFQRLKPQALVHYYSFHYHIF